MSYSYQGDSYANHIIGTYIGHPINPDGQDSLQGGGGDDFIEGLDGADVLIGGDGNDTLDAGQDINGNTLEGGSGNDIYLYVNSGDINSGGANPGDIIIEVADASGGIDTVYMHSWENNVLPENCENLILGVDRVIGANQAWKGVGNSGDNRITGNDSPNDLYGGSDSSNSGDDTIEGLGGDDGLVGYDGNDALDGGQGNDWLSGGLGNDVLLGGTDNDVLWGDDGDDSLDGGVGNDVLEGVAGNDTLDGGAGGDTMNGGAGDDIYYVSNVADVVSESDASGNDAGGLDRVSSLISYTLADRFENLYLSGSSAINGTGNDANNVLSGNVGNNSLSGGLGDDVLYGYTGLDTLTGGAGNDTFKLWAGTGADTVTDFTSGSDKLRVVVKHYSDATLSIGNDTVIGGAATVAGPGGFANTAELVIVTGNISGAIDATSAAAKIGSATAAYALNDTRLFAVDNGTDSAVYFFTSGDTDAVVEESELTLVATLQNTASTSVSDYIFALS